MARTIKKLLSGTGSGSTTIPTSIGPGKLRIVQVYFANDYNGTSTFSVALGGSYDVLGNPVYWIPQFSMLTKTVRVLNVSLPLLSGDQVSFTSSNSGYTYIAVMVEETD